MEFSILGFHLLSRLHPPYCLTSTKQSEESAPNFKIFYSLDRLSTFCILHLDRLTSTFCICSRFSSQPRCSIHPCMFHLLRFPFYSCFISIGWFIYDDAVERRHIRNLVGFLQISGQNGLVNNPTLHTAGDISPHCVNTVLTLRSVDTASNTL